MDSIKHYCEVTRQYDDELTQAVARSVIPETIQAIEDQATQLKALLAWFKQDFFSWVDVPSCSSCGNDGKNLEPQAAGEPTQEEVEGGASRVEVYRCPNCQQETRFPRYTQVMKLCETRQGRCGEWANCFSALVRSLGHETRYVIDWTDHVWTEAYLRQEQRWVHMDACENAYDAPKMYEKGWGKKLTYCIAVSGDEAVDVTQRYIVNKMANRMRRTEVPELWLDHNLFQLREAILFERHPDRAAEVKGRLAREKEELKGLAGKGND